MITTGKILKFDNQKILLSLDEPCVREVLQKGIKTVEIRFNDGRKISAEQRKKIFGIIKDISIWCGNPPEYIRQHMTWDFITKFDYEEFSLSNIDMTTTKEFITYLIEFCFDWFVPTRDSLLNQTEDIGKYLYLCLEHRKCAICNDKAEVHHVDRVGMGFDREKIIHKGLRAIALCRKHHIEVHQNEEKLFERYHIYGIKLDEYLCKKLRLKTE